MRAAPRARAWAVGAGLLAASVFGCPRSPGPAAPEGRAGREQVRPAAPPGQKLDEIGRALGVSFPPRARLVGSASERGIDDLLEAKVEIPAADLPAFVARLPVPPGDFAPGERGLLGPDRDWWDPNRAPRLRTGQTQLPKGRVLNVGIDDSRPDVAIVYLVNHGV